MPPCSGSWPPSLRALPSPASGRPCLARWSSASRAGSCPGSLARAGALSSLCVVSAFDRHVSEGQRWEAAWQGHTGLEHDEQVAQLLYWDEEDQPPTHHERSSTARRRATGHSEPPDRQDALGEWGSRTARRSYGEHYRLLQLRTCMQKVHAE